MRVPEFRPLPPTSPSMPLVTTPIAGAHPVHPVETRSLPPLRYRLVRSAQYSGQTQAEEDYPPEYDRHGERRHDDRRHHRDNRPHLYDFRAHVDRRRAMRRAEQPAEHIDVLA